MIANYALLFLIIGSVMVLSVAFKKLTFSGALTGGLLGLGVYAGAGFTGIAWLGTFFITGTLVTAHKQKWKESAGLSTKKEGMRTTRQVLANGGVSGLLGYATLLLPQLVPTLQVMMAASLASATADTVSSELGVVYGRRFYNICTFKKDKRGLDGVVSVEGTLLGIAGSVLIAVIYAIGFGIGKNMLWIVVAGTTGNLADSILGATLERSRLLNNNAVNFCNTLIAALVALVATRF
jgi:uncharacterized protein (TIGR00297 family)